MCSSDLNRRDPHPSLLPGLPVPPRVQIQAARATPALPRLHSRQLSQSSSTSSRARCRIPHLPNHVNQKNRQMQSNRICQFFSTCNQSHYSAISTTTFDKAFPLSTSSCATRAASSENRRPSTNGVNIPASTSMVASRIISP